ncbi:MAG: SGNH/GDSL hydrolase family protein [Oligoflexus sp.]|nr:SGNH/GDSL hydrolase family protein [Oligoflexus sp.]
MRYLALFILLSSCVYKGQLVENLVVKDQEKWLVGEVANPSVAGIEHLVVFGDSLSDPGNLSSNTFGFVLPHRIFYKGRFSNGPVWADYVGNSLQWTVDNYAVGGALTRPSDFPESFVVKSFPEQIESSGSRLRELNPQKTLIAMWIGPNNYLRNGSEYEDGKGRPEPKVLGQGVTLSIQEIEMGIKAVQKLGFKQFAIGTMPELGGINRNPKGGLAASDATLYEATRLHNDQLHKLIDRLAADNADLSFVTYHAYEINKATYEDPKAFGFSKLDVPCYVGSLSGRFYGKEEFCSDPMGYKFWEYLHPNTRMQCYYAAQFLADISEGKLIGGYSRQHTIDRCLAIKNKS